MDKLKYYSQNRACLKKIFTTFFYIHDFIKNCKNRTGEKFIRKALSKFQVNRCSKSCRKGQFRGRKKIDYL